MSKLMDLLQKEAGLQDQAKDLLSKGKGLASEYGGKAVDIAKNNKKAIGGAVAGAITGGGILARKLTGRQTMTEKAIGAVKKNPRVAAALAALGIGAGVVGAAKTAGEHAYDQMEFAKQAAEELADDCLAKLAFAEQLYKEASYVTDSLEKDASEVEGIESDGSALEAFLEELDAE